MCTAPYEISINLDIKQFNHHKLKYQTLKLLLVLWKEIINAFIHEALRCCSYFRKNKLSSRYQDEFKSIN